MDSGAHYPEGPRSIQHLPHDTGKLPDTVMWAAIGGETIMLPITFTSGGVEYNNLDPSPVTEMNRAIDDSSAQFGSGNTHKSGRFSLKRKESHPTANPTPSPTADSAATNTPTTTTSLKLVRPTPLAIQHEANKAINMEDQTIRTVAARQKKKGMKSSELKASFRD